MSNSEAVSGSSVSNELDAVAWVYGEIERLLKQMQGVLRTQLRERGQEKKIATSADLTSLQEVQAHLHQAVGALELVNVPAAVRMLTVMGQALEVFVKQPDLLNDESLDKLDRACFALLDFLQQLLNGKMLDAVGLFPQYRDVAEAAKIAVQPADLWMFEWQWTDVPLNALQSEDSKALASALSQLDSFMLNLLRGKLKAAEDFKLIAQSLATQSQSADVRRFWALVAGFFDGIATKRIALDLYTKRAASQVHNAYKSFNQSQDSAIEGKDLLGKVLLFFCAYKQDEQQNGVQASSVLAAVRLAYKLQNVHIADYETPLFGRIDPALLKQARKYIATAKAAWSSLCSGESIPAQSVVEAFENVCSALQQIIPPSEHFVQVLRGIIAQQTRHGQAPAAEVAMEVATAVLYIEAVFADLDLNDSHLEERFDRLKERLLLVAKGDKPLPLDPWIEDLYRHVSDRETMGSVVGELRTILDQVESDIDGFLRKKKDEQALNSASAHLRQIHGVLNVLGVDQPARATLAMDEQVRWLLQHASSNSESEKQNSIVTSLGNSLGALGFLIDMLAYQPMVARQMFVYDPQSHELHFVAGRREEQPESQPAEEGVKKEVTETIVPSKEESAALVPALEKNSNEKNNSHDIEFEPTQAIESYSRFADDDSHPPMELDAGLEFTSDDSAKTLKPLVKEETTPEELAPVSAELTVLSPSLEDMQASTAKPTQVAVAQPEPAQTAAASHDAEQKEDDFGDDLREIFLEEAHEVITNSNDELTRLKQNLADHDTLVTIRRGFHTLKGSSRMVGLMEFGSAAWACEQCLNEWIAENKPLTPQVADFIGWAFNQFEAWTNDLQQGSDGTWKAAVFEERAKAVSVHAPVAAQELQPSATFVNKAPVAEPEHEDEELTVEEHEADLPIEFPLEAADLDLSAKPYSAEQLKEAAAAEETIEVDETAGDITDVEAVARDVPFTSAVIQPEPIQPQPIQQAPIRPEQTSQPDILQASVVTAQGSADADLPTVKVVAGIEVNEALYHLYIDEASARIQLLEAALDQWQYKGDIKALEKAQVSAQALAHSSETVGFLGLSSFAADLAQAIEHYKDAVIHAGVPHDRTPVQVLDQVCMEFRRLLDQFEHGKLDIPRTGCIVALYQFGQTDFSAQPSTTPDVAESVEPEPAAQMEQTSVPDTEAQVPAYTSSGDVTIDLDAQKTEQNQEDAAELEVQDESLLPVELPDVDNAKLEAVDVEQADSFGVSPSTPAQTEAEQVDTLEVNEPEEAGVHEAGLQLDQSVDVLQTSEATKPAVVEKVLAPAKSVVIEPIQEKPAAESQNEIDAELFEIFKEEAEDLLPRISAGLREWSDKPDDSTPLTEVLRTLHTFKGSSRLAGAMRLGDMAHELESALKSANALTSVPVEQVQDIMSRVDDLETEFDTLCAVANTTAVRQSEKTTAQSVAASQMQQMQTTVSSDASIIQSAPVDQSHPESGDSGSVTATYQLEPQDRKAAKSDLFPVFKEEAEDLLGAIDSGLKAWMASANVADLEGAMRGLHTLKGSSRLTGAMRMGSLAHGLESSLKIMEGQKPSAEDIRRIQDQFVQIETEFELLVNAEKEVRTGKVVLPTSDSSATVLQQDSAVPAVEQNAVSTSTVNLLDAKDQKTVSTEVFAFFNKDAKRQLDQLSAKIDQWAADPEADAVLVDGLRILNKLREHIYLSGLNRIKSQVQELESTLKALIGTSVEADQIAHVKEQLKAMALELDLLSKASQELQTPRREEGSSAESVVAAKPAQVPVKEDVAAQLPADSEKADEQVQENLLAYASQVLPRTINPTAERGISASGGLQLLRVRASLVDELVNKAGEVNMLRSQLASEVRQLKDVLLQELATNLERLRSQLRDVELQAETQMASRMESVRTEGHGFDPLEFDRYTRIQELTRIMAESVNDVGTVQKSMMQSATALEDGLAIQSRSTREIQRTLLRARMVEFSSIGERFHRVVRVTARECNKQAQLEIIGGDIEVDRAVLDRIAPAFEHILRNCVVHGIEMPDKRLALDKPAVGQITITVVQEGNDVSITIKDDGAGLDLQKIRDKAERMHIIEPGSDVSDYDLAQMIYKAGLSTSEKVTELAGRGVGLDMAHAEIIGLGGRVEVFTKSHEGTKFNMVLPLTTAVTQVVLVSVAGKTFGIPTNQIESIQRFSDAVVSDAVRRGKVDYLDAEVPAYWFGGLLGLPVKQLKLGERKLQWLVLRSAGQQIAVAVDHIIGSQEVVIKNVGPQFAHLTGFSGLTVLTGGRIILIYNPVPMVRAFGEHGKLSDLVILPAEINTPVQELIADAKGVESLEPEMPVQQKPATPHNDKVMVVDDSLTVRRVTQRLLERAGYEVALAKDGQDALNQILQEIPALVLSDIEMPRMDGFELVRKLRSNPETQMLPVIMITSRIAQKHHDYANELGVSHYLGKPYDEDELLRLIGRYVHHEDASTPA